MSKHQYRYKGSETVHLPLHGITAVGGDEKTVYETDVPIKHPDFTAVTDGRKERASDTDK